MLSKLILLLVIAFFIFLLIIGIKKIITTFIKGRGCNCSKSDKTSSDGKKSCCCHKDN